MKAVLHILIHTFLPLHSARSERRVRDTNYVTLVFACLPGTPKSQGSLQLRYSALLLPTDQYRPLPSRRIERFMNCWISQSLARYHQLLFCEAMICKDKRHSVSWVAKLVCSRSVMHRTLHGIWIHILLTHTMKELCTSFCLSFVEWWQDEVEALPYGCAKDIDCLTHDTFPTFSSNTWMQVM